MEQRSESVVAPRDEAAERAVLGSILIRPEIMAELADRLTPEDFYLEQHSVIYRALLDLDNARMPIDSLLVVKRLREFEALGVAGGAGYLMELARSVPTTVNAGRYAELIREKSILREVQGFARLALQEAGTELEDVPSFVDRVAQRALGLSVAGSGRSVVSLGEVLKPAIARAQQLAASGRKGQLTGVTSGFHALDRMTSGWQRSDLIILAARPGMGKTAFALNMLLNAAQDRREPTPGVIFSLEMSAEQLATRMWCSSARVSLHDFRTANLDGPSWDRLYTTMERLHKAQIFIDDTPSIAVTEMMRKCRQLQHEHRIGFVIVDYLQLMSGSDLGRNASRENVISDISRNLKALAKELNVPVVALSQLNRGVESRTDKRPMLSDLRESGAIEQDADIITFLYRDDYYARRNQDGEDEQEASPLPSGPSDTEVIIAKHRSGSTGTVMLEFHGPYTLFANKAADGAPEYVEPKAPLPQDLKANVPDDEPRFAPPPPDPDGTEPPRRDAPFEPADMGDDVDGDLPI